MWSLWAIAKLITLTLKTTEPTYALQKKIFEKLIPKRIIDLQDQNGVGLNGKQQHGF